VVCALAGAVICGCGGYAYQRLVPLSLAEALGVAYLGGVLGGLASVGLGGALLQLWGFVLLAKVAGVMVALAAAAAGAVAVFQLSRYGWRRRR
jgi:hypothetical protein